MCICRQTDYLVFESLIISCIYYRSTLYSKEEDIFKKSKNDYVVLPSKNEFFFGYYSGENNNEKYNLNLFTICAFFAS